MPEHVKVEGVAELRRELRRIADDLPKSLRQVNLTAAEIVARSALPHVPTKTGRLRASIRALGSQREGRVAAGKKNVAYAAAIHWGRKQGNVGSPPGNRIGPNPIVGRPFLWDAAERERGRVIDTYEREIDRLMNTVRSRPL